MANSFAYVVLFGWPLVVFLLFRLLPRPEAIAWSIIGGYLALPFGVGIDPPVLPTFDKTLIPALSAAVMCLMGVAPTVLSLCRSDPVRKAPSSGVRPQAAEQSVFTRQKTRRPVRSSARPTPAKSGMQRSPLIITLLLALLFLTPVLTVLQNTDPYHIGVLTLPGLRLYDVFSMILSTMVMLLPFLLGQSYLGEPEAQVSLLRVLCLSALIYSLPTLFEIRMSPQLARWIYGFLAQSFAQAMRDGGFRPVVFLQHGLWLAVFLAMAALSAFALWRHDRAEGRQSLMWFAGLWLAGVLFLSHSFGALILLLGLFPFLLLFSIRGQLLAAAALAAIVLTYPMLRGAGFIPVDTISSLAASVSQERAGSLKFRLDNEDILLAHANEKPLAGWGGFARSRVFDPETGADISVTDGMWIIVMGVSGWLGYVGTFGLLAGPVILLFFRSKPLGITRATAGLCMILVANMIDMVANATLTPVTWLIAGALAGRCRFKLLKPFAEADSNQVLASKSALKRGGLYGLRQLVVVSSVVLMMPFLGASASAGTGVTDPGLAFGLTGVSD
ncbi:MAG: hypothetical protein ABI832_15580, partial [bacterium]